MSYIGNTKIGKMYLGNTEIGKAYLGNNLVFQKGGQPQPTTQIPYIRGGADGSYIDTGITPDSTTRVIVWARNFNPGADNYTWLFGSRIANQNAMYAIALLNGANTGKMRIAYATTNTDLTDKWQYFTNYHKYELNGKDLYVDDVLVGSSNTGTISTSYSIFLFGLNNAGTFAGCNLPMDICKAQIYKGGSLVRDYTAVSGGLFDAVSNTLFTNAGTGAFTYGTFNPNAYTPLEYLTCTGEQWFNSGVPGTYEDPIVAYVMLTNTNKRTTWALGVYTTEPNEACGIYFGNSSYLNAKAFTRLGANTSTVTIDGGTTANKYTNKKLVLMKVNNTAAVYYNNASQGTLQTVSTMRPGFATSVPITIGTRTWGDYSVSGTLEALIGRMYYALLGSRRSYVPAIVNDVAGMYDTYNDTFNPSESGTPFVAGPTF